MKISNSKRQLAQLLIEAGVTQFPDGADWVAQDKNKKVWPYKGEPTHITGDKCWSGCCMTRLAAPDMLVTNWHQTKLSRDEFDQIIAETAVGSEPDADGWIEWNGGECPVAKGVLVDVKFLDGTIHIACEAMRDNKQPHHKYWTYDWLHCGEGYDIIAYRLHKPEQAKHEFCESVTRSIPEPVAESKPTIEQLAADYRNKLDYANRKQDEAEKAKVESDATLSELEKAIAAIGFAITPIDAVAQYPELVITDWRDLMIGDIIEYVDGDIKDKIGMSGPIVEFAPDATDGMHVRLKCDNGPRKGRLGWPRKWRFIRRPAK